MSKVYSLADACAPIRNGSTILVGGFGQPGTPNTLLRQVRDLQLKELTLIKNDANEPGLGVSLLIEAGQVRRMIASHIGLNPLAVQMMHDGTLQIDVYAQGILAEKIRAGGAGLGGVLTDIGLHLRRNDPEAVTVELNNQTYLVEPSLRGDVALIHAEQADEYGNLVFTGSAYNFNPAMAMAADLVIVETRQIVQAGEIPPQAIHLPGAFVDRLVAIPADGPEYGVLKHHALQE